ncbi:MAG: efflux RND transporter permease subunit [Treponema sp.]|jgi:multidrug efflux pump subunit AcrB|nr:efflux RND transporter permease subunit [Treponema sp.]
MNSPVNRDNSRRSSWLGRKKASLCICLGICALSVFIIASPGESRSRSREASYTVTLRHYGIDVREMERNAAIPLEDALAAIPGVRSVVSASENGRVRAFVRFDRKKAGQYEAVREAAQGVYEGLPASAQRPEILSSDNSRIPLWSAAVLPPEPADLGGSEDRGAYAGEALAFFLERTLKPKLEGLEDAGEVEIYGAGLKEIQIALQPDRAAALGIGPETVAAAMGSADGLFPGGAITRDGREILLTVDGRYGGDRVEKISSGENSGSAEAAALAEAFIPLGKGRVVRLGEIAFVHEQEREPDVLSRLNGKKTAVISVMGSAGADPGKLSRRIKTALDEAGFADPAGQPLKLVILSDRGAEETAAYRSLLSAALEGSLAVSLTAFLLGRGKRRNSGSTGGAASGISVGLVCALTVPGICLVSAALLALLGFPPDRSVLGGLAAGLGAAVDAAILCAAGLRSCRTFDEARAALARLRAPLIAGAATTAASLLPLGAVEGLAGGVTVMAWAIAVVNITALVLSLTLTPPLCLWALKPGTLSAAMPVSAGLRNFPGGAALSAALCVPLRFFHFLARRINRLGCRFLAADLRLCIRRPEVVLGAALLFSAAGICALAINGVDGGETASEDSVFAQVEFEGGLLAEETDRLLSAYTEELLPGPGIKNIQTSARVASGSALVSFDPAKTTAAEIRRLARSRSIPGGFVFFPESSAGERNWEIKIRGDDDGQCRELAARAAALCTGHVLVKEAVLNFKDGSGRLTLLPSRERLSESGVAFSAAAGTVRWGVYGPVAYKRIGPRGETDVRIRGTGPAVPSREAALGILIHRGPGTADAAGGGGAGTSIRLDSLVEIQESREPASIRREDRRRTASFSVRTKVMDPRRVRNELANLLGAVDLPPGYTIEFDPEEIRRAEALSGTAFYFLLALLFCYMVIALVHESFTLPLAHLAAVPPALAFPALCIALSGAPLSPAAACAFVAVSGMAINASVLSAGGLDRYLDFRGGEIKPYKGGVGDRAGSFALYRGLRKILPLLLATGGTTIAGALPFLLLREGANTLVRTLSLVSALGVGASCFCSLCIIPSLAVKRPKLFLRFFLSEKHSA